MADLGEYAKTVCDAGAVESEAVRRAFATVPREQYLGAGPWRVVQGRSYETTVDANPEQIYRDVLVAIDESRGLNNGQPSALARWFGQLDPQPGERVLHVGCGVGYYTAILVETVGASGQVTGVEIDAVLAERARENLAHYANARVIAGDGATVDAGTRDVIFVNAGATQVRRTWVEALDPGGRLILPLTMSEHEQGAGVGYMLRVIRRSQSGFAAHFTGPVGIYPCLGSRDPEADKRLRKTYSAGGHETVRSLRLDSHAREESCWLHAGGVCLSRAS